MARSSPRRISGFAAALAAAVGVPVSAAATSVPAAALSPAIANDLQGKSRPRARRFPAEHTPRQTMLMLAYAINAKLAAIGNTVTYTEPAHYRPARREDYSLAALTTALKQADGGHHHHRRRHPVYTAPADLRFGEPLPGMRRFGFTSPNTKTRPASVCDWSVPLAHPLEAWSDLGRATARFLSRNRSSPRSTATKRFRPMSFSAC